MKQTNKKLAAAVISDQSMKPNFDDKGWRQGVIQARSTSVFRKILQTNTRSNGDAEPIMACGPSDHAPGYSVKVMFPNFLTSTRGGWARCKVYL